MKKFLATKITAVLLAVMFLFSSCASILSRASYPLSVNCDPNASVTITDKNGKEVYKGTTPASVSLKAGAGFFSKAEYQVKLSSPGYADKIVPVSFKLDGWYFGNILIGGLLGMLIIDPATGAMWKIEDEFMNETLVGSPNASTEPGIKVVNYSQIPESWESHLVKID